MNQILALKGKFSQKRNAAHGGAPTLPGGALVTVSKIKSLRTELHQLADFWKQPAHMQLGTCLVSARYIKIAAKSNRLGGFFSEHSSNPSDLIVGAKFTDELSPKHVITYRVELSLIEHTLDDMQRVIKILTENFDGKMDPATIAEKSSFDSIDFKTYGIVKTTFQKCVVDAWYVSHFELPQNNVDTSQAGIITVFDTKQDTISLLRKFGVPAFNQNLLDSHTILLDEQALNILMDSAPFLVAMSIVDINQYVKDDSAVTEHTDTVTHEIPAPSNEPIVGVIDTLFDERTYVHEWVQFENCIKADIDFDDQDYYHGSQVSSLIVDGPSLNPSLDDGCGRFRVKHFGVALNRPTSSVDIIRRIRKIVNQNPEIHVWNLSLGSDTEINRNFISAEGAVLDQIQAERNIIFVVAATNQQPDNQSLTGSKRIGAPADSLNSLVVGSVDTNTHPANYARRGGVLSFFVKPDISYYGGSHEKMLQTADGRGGLGVEGTSFATPWIARKLAYLIEVIGLSREVAKALLIDAAISWHPETDDQQLELRGNGVVPIRIADILSTTDDEIKFVMDGISEKYDTYNYQIPVPIVKQHQPFLAKATLCYNPSCSRNHGVDYTDTEMDLYFGRINNKGKIKTINQNIQATEQPGYVLEDDARTNYRKWDNVKHITELLKPNSRAKKIYNNPLWGISIKTKERSQHTKMQQLKFGMVITLHEIKGVNRIEDFIQQASLAGWFVGRIDINERLNIYQQAEAEVNFTDDDVAQQGGDAD